MSSSVRSFSRLLVANRGEIARRVFRTAHRLGLETVAVYSEVDAQALHVGEATQSYALGGSASADSYLRIDKLIAAAKATGADAIHPGYGFLSENADFAQAVVDAGLVWVGPPAQAIRALGSKSAAKQIAQSRGIPCLPGYHGSEQSDELLVAHGQRVGLPLMVKAVAGGGGRGMRLVSRSEQLLPALQSARSEALSAFGSGELLLERAILSPRHVEVQIFADSHGNCIHLGERDCSVQRRHQKIIEETPSPAVDEALRQRMGQCAIELAQAARYVGAGTVEFLLDGDAFFLMEMNTRLQVEHPVTEAVTGLDLVEWQLRVARGEPLPLAQDQVRFSGHAIEVRLCAEDEKFVPHSGEVKHFRAPAGVRFDHALAQGQRVSAHYDSMLGKVVAHASDRDEAINQLAGALDRTQVLGLPTNRALLAACLRHPDFRAGQALIPFLDVAGDELRQSLAQAEQSLRVEAAQAILGSRSGPATLACPFERPFRLRHRGEVVDVPVQGARLASSSHQTALVSLGAGRWHVQLGAVDMLVQDASFEPSGGAGGVAMERELRAPFNGKVIAVQVAPGDVVARASALLTIESMKLEHALMATRDGVVQVIHVVPGQQVATSQLLVSFEFNQEVEK